MKIISLGKVKVKKTKIVCFKCESVLEYDLRDIKSDRDGKFIICAACGQFIAV